MVLPTAEQLEALYGSSKTYGPYLCKDGRYRIDVWHKGKCRTRQLAKVLLEVKLGRVLLEGEVVDHKDEDKSNDSLDNLQPLTKSDNAKKSHTAGNNPGLKAMQDYARSAEGRSASSLRNSGTSNARAKLTQEQVLDIRSRVRYRGLVRDLMAEFSLCRRTIQNLLKNNAYKQ